MDDSIVVAFSEFTAQKPLDEIITIMAVVGALAYEEITGNHQNEVPASIRAFMKESKMTFEGVYNLLKAVLEVVYKANGVPTFEEALRSMEDHNNE